MERAARTSAPGPRGLSAIGGLPPGPRLPRLIQTAGFIVGGVRFLEAIRRRYGEIVTLGTLFDSGFVMLFDPGLVKELFQGSGDQLHAARQTRCSARSSASARCCCSTAPSTCVIAG